MKHTYTCQLCGFEIRDHGSNLPYVCLRHVKDEHPDVVLEIDDIQKRYTAARGEMQNLGMRVFGKEFAFPLF